MASLVQPKLHQPKLLLQLSYWLLVNYFLCCCWPVSDACQYTKFSSRHTMCYYKTSGCPLKERGVSKHDIQYILDEHNTYRQMVAKGQGKQQGSQPQAADMRQMEWDNELALVAQKWAEQCKTQHDCSDCRQLPRFRVGQNIYMYASTEDNATTDWYTAVHEWYKEVAIFPSGKIEPFQHPQAAGHYTQLAWANSHKIGCGYAYFQKGIWFTKLYVCDYGPVGNILGDRMYVRGAACSACPDGTRCSGDYPGLCSESSVGGGVPIEPVKPSVAVTAKPWWAVTPTTTRLLVTRPLTLTTLTTTTQLKPWWVTSTRRPAFTKPPAVKKVLLNCDFDHKGCAQETVGSAQWALDTSNAADAQGNYYDVYLKRGQDGHLYVYATMDGGGSGGEDAVTAGSGGKACLSFSYKKFPLNGKQSADLEVALWRQKQATSFADFGVQANAYRWTTHRMTVPAYPDVYSISFHMSVPKSGQMGDQYLSVDQIRLDPGACVT